MHHVKPVAPVRDILCPKKCGFKTHKEDYLRLHVKRVHDRIREFSCQTWDGFIT